MKNIGDLCILIVVNFLKLQDDFKIKSKIDPNPKRGHLRGYGFLDFNRTMAL